MELKKEKLAKRFVMPIATTIVVEQKPAFKDRFGVITETSIFYNDAVAYLNLISNN
jgi:hypothetical protein